MRIPGRKHGSHALMAALGLLALGSCGVVENSVLATEVERPIEVLAVFKGNDSLIDRRLFLAARADLLLLSEGASPEGAAFDAALSIVDTYLSEGFADAQVEATPQPPQTREGKPDLVEVRFVVTEGPQVTVRELKWNGVGEDISQDELTALWARRGSGTLGLGPPLFVLAEMESLATAVRSTLRQRGHLRVEVDAPEVSRVGTDSVDVQLNVRPGPVFEVGKVTIEPALLEPLAEPPELPTGAFSSLRVQELAIAIRAGLRRKGHPNPDVRVLPTSPNADQTVDVQVVGSPGATAEFGEVRIEGNTYTDRDYVESKLRFTPGKPFDGSAVEKSVEDLYRTRLFRRVQVEPLPIQDGRTDVDVRLEETERQTVEFLAGYGSYEGFRGGATYIGRNLVGQGREYRVGGRVSQRGFQASTEITDRDLFGSDVSGTLRASLFRREEPSFTDRAAEATGFIGFDPVVGIGTRLGYSLIERLDSRVFANSPAATLENFTEGRVFVELYRDTRDSVLTPTRGYNASIEADLADSALGSDIEYYRLRGHIAGHLPLAGDTRLSLRWTTGLLWPQDGSDRIPLQVRFYNGGETTIRSFRQDRLGPLDDAALPLGGEYRNVLSAEFRVPLARSLEGSVFADAGNIGAQVQDYSLDGFSYAVGIGARVVLPIGPLRVDAAFNPAQDPLQDEWVVQFSVGYPF